jgi:hypothetical protein
MLLSLYGNDFDLILTTDKDSFLDRFTEEEKENAKSWKESIDNFLNNEYLIKKTVNVGNLYMSDIMALNDNIDLFELLQSENPDVKSLAEKIVTIIENISQST